MSMNINKVILKKILLCIVVAMLILSSVLLVACNNDNQTLKGQLLGDPQNFQNANMDYAENSNTTSVLPNVSSWSANTASSRAKSGNIVVNANATAFANKADWDNFKKNVDAIKTRQERQNYFKANFDWKTGYIWAYLDHLEYNNSNKKPFYFTDITSWQQVPALPEFAQSLKKANADFKTEELEKRDFWAADNYKKVQEYFDFVKNSSVLKDIKSNTVTPNNGFSNDPTSLLMLANFADNNQGTSTSYTSVSMTLPAGTMARISIDVCTALTQTKGYGANIAITPTIGGNARAALVLNNIETSTWKTYTFYLQSSVYADTSFTVSLGLGRQASMGSTFGNAEGYAFFDNLTYEIDLTKNMRANASYKQEIDSATTKTLNVNYNSSGDFNAKREEIVTASTVNTATLVYNCDVSNCTNNSPTFGTTTKQTQGRENVTNSTFNDYFAIQATPATAGNNTDTPVSVMTNSITINNSHQVTSNANFTGNVGIPTTIDDLLSQNSNASFTLGANQYAIVGMWVNSTVTTTIKLVETTAQPYNTESITVKTDDINPVRISDDKNGTRTNIYGVNNAANSKEKWQYVQFFISTGKKQATFKLQLFVGLTEFSSQTDLASFPAGTAIIAQPNLQLNVPVTQYNMHTTSDYCKEVTLKGAPDPTGGFGKSRTINDSAENINTIDVQNASVQVQENVIAQPTQSKKEESLPFSTTTSNTIVQTSSKARAISGVSPNFDGYIGAVGGSRPVGGNAQANSTPTSQFTGLLHKDQIKESEFTTPTALATLISNWKKGTSPPLLSSDTPLLIYGQNFGYYAATTTSLTANGYFAVHLRMLLANGAKAYVYLVEVDNTNNNYKTNILQTKLGYNYCYDVNGNVVPAENKNANALFYKQSNGLWTRTSNGGGIYYANLKNYKTQTDTKHTDYNEKNLVDPTGTIVYYYRGENNGNPQYTRTKNDKDFVQDFTAAVANGVVTQAELDSATYRDAAPDASNQLMVEVTGTTETETNGVNLNFYIATGSTERNYRLEVFLGSRDGQVTANATDWVMYTTLPAETLDETKFGNLLKESQTDLANIAPALGPKMNNPNKDFSLTEGNNTVNYWYYSLFDSGYYAPYNAKTSNLTGDPYASYDASQYKKQVAYMQVHKGNTITTIANFKAFENNVASSDVTTKPTATKANFAGNIPLLVTSSILIAAILAAVIVLLCRRLLKNRKFKTKKKQLKVKPVVTKVTPQTAPITTDVLPNKDEISSEELYNFDTEENNSTIKEDKD